MTPMQFDTTLTRNEVDRTVAAIAPEWRVRETTPMEAGHHAVYRLVVETSRGDRECFLKATPDGKDPAVDLEARLLAVLDRHTSIPVPSVHGMVDDHDDLPAPFVLVEGMPGEAKFRTELASLPDDFLRRVARDTGRHLADLHALDAVEDFGFLTHDGPALHGGRPDGDLETVAVADPIADWRARCHDWTSVTLDNLEETRFADVVPEARPAIEVRVDDLEGPFEPVLARIDQSLDNVVLDGADVSAMLDWEFTIAATPAYDVVSVAWSIAGGPYLFDPAVPDRRDLVYDAILAGYRERDPGGLDRFHSNWTCYELLSALRSMVHLEEWFRTFDLGDRIDDAAAEVRQEVSTHL